MAQGLIGGIVVGGATVAGLYALDRARIARSDAAAPLHKAATDLEDAREAPMWGFGNPADAPSYDRVEAATDKASQATSRANRLAAVEVGAAVVAGVAALFPASMYVSGATIGGLWRGTAIGITAGLTGFGLLKVAEWAAGNELKFSIR